jgi:hypothetical protein
VACPGFILAGTEEYYFLSQLEIVKDVTNEILRRSKIR